MRWRFSAFETILQDIDHRLLKLSEGELIIELAITIFSHTLEFLKEEYSDTIYLISDNTSRHTYL